VLEGCFVRAGDASDVLGTQAVLGLPFEVVAAGVIDDELVLSAAGLRLFKTSTQAGMPVL
jgi:hypothetical protein